MWDPSGLVWASCGFETLGAVHIRVVGLVAVLSRGLGLGIPHCEKPSLPGFSTPEKSKDKNPAGSALRAAFHFLVFGKGEWGGVIWGAAVQPRINVADSADLCLQSSKRRAGPEKRWARIWD